MRCPQKPPDEHGRLSALAEYEATEARSLVSLAPIVDLAASLFDCPAAAVNLVGDENVILAASQGIGEVNLSRDVSFCAHAINEQGIMVIEDAALDPRFHDNPLVESGMVRFYAGVALRSPSGHALGALCVIDNKPHTAFPPRDCARLEQLASLVSDRLELRRMEVAARAGAAQFAKRAIASPSAIVTCDDHGRVLNCNEAAANLLGLSTDALGGRDIESLIAIGDRDQARAFLCDALSSDLPANATQALALLRPDGTTISVALHGSPWLEGGAARIGLVIEEIPEDRDSVSHLANFDIVTRLPNRKSLLLTLEQAFAQKRELGLILTDLVGFSDINTTLGHAAGDMALNEIGQRILKTAPDALLVARIGGDEFALLFDLRDPLALSHHAQAINAALGQSLWVERQEVRLGSCCGIAMAPDHAQAPEELLGNAELALLDARRRGKGRVSLYAPHLRAQAVARRLAEAELHHAFEEGQFTLAFQPQVCLADGALTGAEALLRWQHPTRGLLLPAKFLSLLEESSLAADVGTWVIHQACAQAALWRRTFPAFVVAVNLFAAQFQKGNLPELVTGALKTHGLPHSAIDLEITENIVLDDQDGILAQLWQLREAGIRLSFDDFGTGFASLNLLRDFPVSHIKVDKSFIQLAASSAKDRAIVLGLIRMGHKLGLEVTAEGIETHDCAQWLARHHCDKGQGYHFGGPYSPCQFVDHYLLPTSEHSLTA